jgi:hypothetical protein
MIDAVAMRKLVLTTAILLLSVAAFFWLSGSVVVIDETRGVQTAVITNSGGSEQELHRLWSGFFYAIPRMEGTIEVRCIDGTRKQWGYVTGHIHVKLRIVGKTPCEKLLNA